MKNLLKKPKVPRFKIADLIWLFPGLALVVCISLFLNYWQERGPTIKIYFSDATNIQVEKTRVRYRGVEIGVVKKVEISKDTEDAVVDVTLQRSAADMAVVGSKFWLVAPKVGLQGVSGLETLFTGSYIAVEPGRKNADVAKTFKGHVESQSSDSTEDTVAYYLVTKSLDSVSAGDEVTFRGLKIGAVTKVVLDKPAQNVHVQINIQDKYVRLIRTNTSFWRKVGIQAKLGLFNSEIKINSLESLLRGGVALATPEPAGKIAKALTRFPLSTEPPKEFEKWNTNLEARAQVRAARP